MATSSSGPSAAMVEPPEAAQLRSLLLRDMPTTLRIRHVPLDYTEEMLVEQWPRRIYGYDMLYWEFTLLFINFTTPQLALAFQLAIHQQRLPLFTYRRRTLRAHPAVVQGRQQLLLRLWERQQSGRKATHRKPLIFDGDTTISVAEAAHAIMAAHTGGNEDQHRMGSNNSGEGQSGWCGSSHIGRFDDDAVVARGGCRMQDEHSSGESPSPLRSASASKDSSGASGSSVIRDVPLPRFVGGADSAESQPYASPKVVIKTSSSTSGLPSAHSGSTASWSPPAQGAVATVGCVSEPQVAPQPFNASGAVTSIAQRGLQPWNPVGTSALVRGSQDTAGVLRYGMADGSPTQVRQEHVAPHHGQAFGVPCSAWPAASGESDEPAASTTAFGEPVSDALRALLGTWSAGRGAEYELSTCTADSLTVRLNSSRGQIVQTGAVRLSSTRVAYNGAPRITWGDTFVLVMVAGEPNLLTWKGEHRSYQWWRRGASHFL